MGARRAFEEVTGPVRSRSLTLRLVAFAMGFLPIVAVAQPFDPGPAGTVVGSSAAGMRIGGPVSAPAGRIPGAEVFGDTVTERTYGRAYDDSYLTPEIPGGADAAMPAAVERAIEGRPALDGLAAGAFARGGSSAIGGSAITRGSSTGPHRPVPSRR